jgi:hypothetical protein
MNINSNKALDLLFKTYSEANFEAQKLEDQLIAQQNRMNRFLELIKKEIIEAAFTHSKIAFPVILNSDEYGITLIVKHPEDGPIECEVIRHYL